MYVAMRDILDKASAENYAVVAANCINMETIVAAIGAAEAENSPIIINLGESQMKGEVPRAKFESYIVKQLAYNSKVPVALNLDHGKEFENIVKAIRFGFTSVMIDASLYPIEENIARTKEVVKLAHSIGVSVEAELGHVGMGSDYTAKDPSELYTDPKEAKYFVEQTKVDALAVAVGTAHGVYKGIPKIDFDRLRELKETLDMPLVLHGGSGTGDENLRKAVECGINKINIFTDSMIACRDSVLKELKQDPETNYMKLMQIAEDAMKQKLRYYIRLFGSANKA